MGYIHYWRGLGTPTDKEWVEIITKVQQAYEKLPKHRPGEICGLPLKLNGCSRFEEPMFSSQKIWFNGCNGGKRILDREYGCWKSTGDDLGCETFAVERNNFTGFNFCKTNRRPYDFMVCICLIVLKSVLKNKIAVSSDGKEYDWDPAIEWCFNQLDIDLPFEQIVQTEEEIESETEQHEEEEEDEDKEEEKEYEPFQIMYDDLTPEAQKALCELWETTEDCENWACMPLATIERSI